MLWIQIKPWTYRLSLWFIHFRLQLTQAWSTNFQPIKTRDTKTCAWNMSTPLPREWGCLSTCNTNLGGQLLLLWGVSTWKSFFLASEKVSFLNAEAWKNLIEICLYHSQQSYANLRWKNKMQRKPAYIGGRLDECKEKSRKEIKTPPNLFSIHHENM